MHRYQPLASQLRTQRRLAARLEYICYQDSAEVQVEAVRVATELVQVRSGKGGEEGSTQREGGGAVLQSC